MNALTRTIALALLTIGIIFTLVPVKAAQVVEAVMVIKMKGHLLRLADEAGSLTDENGVPYGSFQLENETTIKFKRASK